MKKLKIILLSLILLIPFNINALVTKSNNLYVTDEANMLSKDTKNCINVYSKFLNKEEKIDYYVVTINSLEDNTIEDYANYIYKSFNINKKGLLILVSKEDRQIRVQTGPSLSAIVPKKIIDEYINKYFMPYLKNDDWNTGIKNGYSAFYKMLCNYYEIDSSPMTVYSGNDFINKYKYLIFLAILSLCIFISRKVLEYIEGIKNKKIKPTALTDFIFIVSILLNIYLLVIEYYLIPLGVLIVIGFEIVTFLPFIFPDNKKKIKHKKVKNNKHK